MTREEVQTSIRNIMFTNSDYGVDIFTLLRVEGEFRIKKLRTTDKLLDGAGNRLADTINTVFLSENTVFEVSDNVADNRKAIYEIELSDDYNPFIFLQGEQNIQENYSEADRKNLMGLFFKMNLNDQYFWIYQHIYPVARMDRSKHILAVFVKDVYDELDNDIVQIDSRTDMVIISNHVFTAKIDLMQRYFGFEDFIRAGAQNTIEILNHMDVVRGLENIIALENHKRLTNAKKLLKARNSPVLRMNKDELLNKLQNHGRYRTMLTFEDNYIVIKSQKDALAFVKMLNDDIVRSELTGQEYDSSSKSILREAEA